MNKTHIFSFQFVVMKVVVILFVLLLILLLVTTVWMMTPTTPAESTVTVTPPIDCVMSDWTEWSSCDKGRSTRTRTVSVQPLNGGEECSALQEERECGIIVPNTDHDPTDFYIKQGEFSVIRGDDHENVRNSKLNALPVNSDGRAQLISRVNTVGSQQFVVLHSGTSVTYGIKVSEDGSYNIGCYLFAPGGNSDSFFVTLDDNSEEQWHTGTASGGLRVWKTVPLVAGRTHMLRIRYREPTGIISLRVDRVKN